MRLRDKGFAPGILPTGPLNAITDVEGVLVGHTTLIEGCDIRTGATAILPHGGSLFQDKVPAGVVVGNGYGKLMGSTQIAELGEIETPILLTNTMAVPRAADAILDWTLAQPGNEKARSINMVVGETNDSYLNDIRQRVLTPETIGQAIHQAQTGPVAEGCVGAGTGTVCFGWKGGIGTSSRRLSAGALPGLEVESGGYNVGVLVQSNYGGVLQILGAPVGVELGQYYGQKFGAGPVADSSEQKKQSPDGSIMMIVATDAPLSDRNLTRLATRCMAGLARTGASMSDGSGDYAIAFSTNKDVRRTVERRESVAAIPDLPNALMSPLFQAVIEATEEAILNSLCMATTVTGYRGRTVEALPLDRVVEMLGGNA